MLNVIRANAPVESGTPTSVRTVPAAVPMTVVAPIPAANTDDLPAAVYGIMVQRTPGLCHVPAAGTAEWYPPVMAGAGMVARDAVDAATIKEAGELLGRLTPDAYSVYLRDFYTDGLARFGEKWGYADIVTVLLALGRALQPRHYLEIGVRRGRSVAAVVSVAPACAIHLFDKWVKNYAGMENPGREFVDEELDRLGHTGTREYVDGNSHATLPAFFADNPDLALDLITVDGDHSEHGAAQDLADVLPRLAIGGAVVFDDICHPKHPELEAVWHRLVADDRRFSTWNYKDAGYGVGFAIRRY
jgi:Methyltransferase domain